MLADNDGAETTANPDVRLYYRVPAYLHIAIDHGIRADFGAGRDPGLFRDDGCWVNFQTATIRLSLARVLIHESVAASKSLRRR